MAHFLVPHLLFNDSKYLLKFVPLANVCQNIDNNPEQKLDLLYEVMVMGSACMLISLLSKYIGPPKLYRLLECRISS